MKKIILAFSFCLFISPALAAKDCTCSHKGAKTPEGQTACIKTSKGMEMAQCSRVLNNTSWKFLGTPCPSANLQTDDHKTLIDLDKARMRLKDLG